VVNANGISTLKHALIQSQRNVLCPHENLSTSFNHK